ncbi:MAG: hypothetical protein ACI9U2_001218 [Bradymonadia bacterium]|jgi:hypothetical protein
MKGAAALLVVIALSAVGVWFAHGQHMATLDKELVTTTVTDDFGDEVKKNEWKDTFKIGLDIAGPVAGGSLGLAGLLLFINRRKRKSSLS